ncbi:MAG TPA: GGDEF domain-containing protein [Gemmatimonadales bacterium]|nr:GGDEF domain-containing protein [Gemmatimonadales bacterium]
MIGLAAGLVAGGLAGWFAARLAARRARRIASDTGPAAGPHLLPDPALDWLRRAHGALGIWVSEEAGETDEPRTERVVDAEQLSVAQIAAVDRRLERAREQEQGGGERIDGGTLVYRAHAGIAVAMLLPDAAGVDALGAAERDLDRLLEGARQRPQIVALAQARSQEAALESVGSVGLRLAYQLERSVGSEIVVVAREPSGVRVVGVSGLGDRRTLDAVLPPDSELARVATGAAGLTLTEGDALGGVVADRRQRQGRTLLAPIGLGRDVVGAVSIHLPSGIEPIGAARTELLETLAEAAPRLRRALEADQAKRAMTIDPLTSLAHRRGLDQVMRRQDMRRGALILADLDNFKQLNDALGHPAGDAALVHFARILREQVRAGDTPARTGGEEFAIWLPDASLELGIRIAERIRIKLGTTPWDWKGRHWPLSASFGVAACPDTSRSLENLYAQADAALFVAKRSGRNRVEAAGRS